MEPRGQNLQMHEAPGHLITTQGGRFFTMGGLDMTHLAFFFLPSLLVKRSEKHDNQNEACFKNHLKTLQIMIYNCHL